MKSTILHTILVLCLCALLAANSIFAALLLLTAIIFVCFLLLIFVRVELFAVILFFCEMHVCFLLFCIALTFVRHDVSNAVKYKGAPSSTLVFFSGLSIVTMLCVSDISFLEQSAAIIELFDLYGSNRGGNSLLKSVALLYVSFFSFEFVLINIFIFFVIVLLTAVVFYFKRAGNTLSAKTAKMLVAELLRAQSQAKQLNKKLSSRGIVAEQKKQKKCYKN